MSGSAFYYPEPRWLDCASILRSSAWTFWTSVTSWRFPEGHSKAYREQSNSSNLCSGFSTFSALHPNPPLASHNGLPQWPPTRPRLRPQPTGATSTTQPSLLLLSSPYNSSSFKHARGAVGATGEGYMGIRTQGPLLPKQAEVAEAIFYKRCCQ